MDLTVPVPLWLLLLLALLAGWTVVFSLLLPSIRWILRHPARQALAEANRRLSIRIQPFKLTRREVLIERLINDPEVLEAVEEEARQGESGREAVLARVGTYAREIVPAFNAYLYFRLGYGVARAAARSLYRVRLGSSDEAALAAIPPDATVVFVINHRSNMDYVLVSYLAAERTALSYAVGEWARIWPLQQLIRSMGAYFVRRNSGDPLYRKVLERYVHMATQAGVTQAVFPEGGLSRDGALRPPRLGLLDYIVRDFDPRGRRDVSRDVVFVPVAINYDRVLEDRTLLLDLLPREERRPAPAMTTTLRFVARNVWLMLRSEWHRFGYACVNFGAPVSLSEHLARTGVDAAHLDRASRFEVTGRLAAELMAEIGRVVPVLPVPLLARVFEEAGGEGLSELEIKARFLGHLARLQALGAKVYIPRQDQDYAAQVGLRMLLLRRMVSEEEGLFRARPEEARLLAYYANSIRHLDSTGGVLTAA
ncbi:MAG TPA: 1-acyl-sn-glycerol-3-phosphate acyltransferase [Thermoanaerobaculia bacterium]|nr:1-acyl-sn-glycerol-3-phosphate acyltransferase [Thermoanaerobaculia bacterium]